MPSPTWCFPYRTVQSPLAATHRRICVVDGPRAPLLPRFRGGRPLLSHSFRLGLPSSVVPEGSSVSEAARRSRHLGCPIWCVAKSARECEPTREASTGHSAGPLTVSGHSISRILATVFTSLQFIGVRASSTRWARPSEEGLPSPAQATRGRLAPPSQGWRRVHGVAVAGAPAR